MPQSPGWRPMAKARRDGVTVIARRNPEDLGQRGRPTWWGADSHGAVGWCLAIGPDDIELWLPDEFHRQGASVAPDGPQASELRRSRAAWRCQVDFPRSRHGG